jgi:hypothetical protein
MIYWQSVYKFKPRLSEIKLTDLNLEIIVTDRGDLLAYRHDGPSDMNINVKNEGGWNLFNEESLNPAQKDELLQMIAELNLVRLRNKKSDQIIPE